MKKLLILSILTISLLGFISCDIEVNISSEGSGTNISFKGIGEEGFEKLINSVTKENEPYIDTVEIARELENAGFTKVKCSSKNTSELYVSAYSSEDETFPFTSDLIIRNGKSYDVNFSRENMVYLYNNVSPQIKQFLDLLLAPVFNDEEMTGEEYLDVVAAFYGSSIADELKESKVKIIVNGKKLDKKYSLVDILCGN